MKKWMIYTLVVAVVVAVILIVTLPTLLNKEPVLEAPVQVVNQGEKLGVNLKPYVKDEKVDEVTLEKIDGPGTLSGFNFTFEPGFRYVGEVVVKIKATDKQGKSSTGDLVINVIRVNRPPEIDTTPLRVLEGETLVFDLNTIVKDPDNDKITFSVDGPGELNNGIYTYSPGYLDSGTKILRVSAKDSSGNETVRDIQLQVIDVNAPPELAVEDQTVNEGELLSLDLAAIAFDIDGDEIELSLASGPGEIVNGVYKYRPGFDEAGDREVVVRVRDGFGNEVLSSFSINVVDVNRPPRMIFSDLSVKEGQELVIQLSNHVIDPDGDELEISVEGPGEIVGDKFIYRPGYDDAGEKLVTIMASDGRGGRSVVSFSIRVIDVNRPPRLMLSDKVIEEGKVLTIDLKEQSLDLDGDELFFELVERPGSVSEGVYSYEPTYEESGEYTVTIKVSDGKAETTGSFAVVVLDVNRPPVASFPDGKVEEGERYELYLKAFASDPDRDELEFEVISGPGEIEDGTYSYEPTYEDAGEKEVSILVSDGRGGEIIVTFKIEVIDVNRPPRLMLSDKVVEEGKVLTIDLKEQSLDLDGDELFFELVEGPGSVSEGVYSYEPTYEESGEYTVTIKVSDSEAETTGSFTVVVLDVNRPPIVDVRDDTVNEGHQYELYIRAFAYDPDGDDISFEILEGPGTIEGDYYTYEADFGSAGTKVVKLRVSDTRDGHTDVTFEIVVMEVNRPPARVVPSISSSIRETFTLQLNLKSFFVDPDGDELTFTHEGPGSIEGSSYTYTPGYEDAGEKEVLITAEDGRGGSVTLPIRITVLDVNRLPVASFPDGKVEEGEIYELYLKAFASDPDRDELEFEVISGPGEIEDGTYSYEPTYEDAGEKEVSILVSDGRGGEIIATFKLIVEDVKSIISLIYAIPTFESGTLSIVAGNNEITSTGNLVVVNVRWVLNFDTIEFWKVSGEIRELIGISDLSNLEAPSSRPIVSQEGIVGYIYLEVK